MQNEYYTGHALPDSDLIKSSIISPKTILSICHMKIVQHHGDPGFKQGQMFQRTLLLVFAMMIIKQVLVSHHNAALGMCKLLSFKPHIHNSFVKLILCARV